MISKHTTKQFFYADILDLENIVVRNVPHDLGDSARVHINAYDQAGNIIEIKSLEFIVRRLELLPK